MTKITNSLWVERYRPQSIQDCILPENIKSVFKEYVKENDIPHLLLSGGAGCGKCVTKDSMVLTDQGLSYISDFSEGTPGYSERIISVFNGNNIEQTSHFYEEEGKNLIQIENSFGYRVTGTPEHPMRCLNTSTMELEWVKLKDITTEHTMLVQYNTNVFGDYQPLSYVSNFSNKATNLKPMSNVPAVLTEELAELIGFVVANGVTYKGNIGISTHSKTMQTRIMELASVFGDELCSINFNNKGVSLGKDLSGLILSVYDAATARYKRTPKLILQSPKSVQCAYLRALIDSDGYSDNLNVIEYYTASEYLALEVSNMLNNLGIFNRHKRQHGATVGGKYYDHTYHTICIGSSDIDVYSDAIGSIKYDFVTRPRNTNIKVIPDICEYVKNARNSIRAKLKVDKSGSYTNADGKRVRFNLVEGNSMFLRSLDGGMQDYLSRLVINEPALTKLIDLVQPGMLYSKVVSVQNVPNEKVYDFTLPDNHKFWCNSLISHNTTSAKALCNEIGCDSILINASLENGIDVIRTKISQYASSVSMNDGDAKHKVIILDEADYLTPAAQSSLRGFIEQFSDNCRFIMTCNSKNRIIKPLHSRCNVIDFNIDAKAAPKMQMLMFKRLCAILKENNVEFELKVVAELVKTFFPDFRRTMGELQRYSKGGKVDAGILAQLSNVNIDTAIDYLKEKNFRDLRKWVEDNADSDPAIIFEQLYDSLYTALNPASVPTSVLILADYMYKSSTVASQEINTMACMVELMSELKFK